MLDWLVAQAQVNGRKEAINGLEYSEYCWHALKTAGYLVGEGVQPGQHVATLLANAHPYAIVLNALRMVGAVVVPLNLRLTPDEIAWQVKNADCRFLLCDRTTAGQASTLSLGECRTVSLDYADDMPFPHLYRDENGGGLDQITAFADAEIDLDKPCAIIHTSGTTGFPKVAVLTYGNFFYSAMASAYRIGHLPEDRWLCCLPLYHVGGLSIILRCCLYGTTVVLHDGFDVEAVSQALDTERITMISLVPTMLYRLLEARGDKPFPDSLRLVLLGGAAASPELLERCFALNIPVAPTYGLSEAASQVATITPGEARRKPGSLGKPLMFTSVRIADDNGASLLPGEYGEIIVSGPTVMAGYYGDPDATNKTLHDGGLHTGDIGYVDEDGDLWLVQRRGDLIVTGGENVYPAEVERVLKAHPAVADVCVVGLDHPEWGQQVAAAVVLRPGMTVTDAELMTFSREHLAGYKLPRRFLFVELLPQTASGKIQRRAVVELFTSNQI